MQSTDHLQGNTARIALTKLPVLRFFMPFIIIPFGIFMLHSSPGHFMRCFFATGVITPIFFIFILIPCAVERFFIDILGMRRKHVLYAFRQIAFRFIRHR
ncbi:hypothetical protein UTI89_C1412 [Escherichia coli UTI89]|uniref:Uncharacterized protein n=2 Tax=Escherichia coli TaxID=562 RepID=A0A0H2YYC8_ECOK1|nr:hypothetical protein UTI89_C1412 [Escherichia coli UTI89]ABJ00634.1 conserved hypothetical protein [Escherichia coli APEC O1]